MSRTDWTGTLGVALVLIAYFLSTFKWISAHSHIFFAMNILGAALSCYASYLISYWPFFVLEGIWALVSLAGWAKIKSQQKAVQ